MIRIEYNLATYRCDTCGLVTSFLVPTLIHPTRIDCPNNNKYMDTLDETGYHTYTNMYPENTAYFGGIDVYDFQGNPAP
jgi:hypothetical protein